MSAERRRALVQPSDFLPKVGGSVTFLVLRTRRRSSRLEDLRVCLIKSNRKRTRAYLAPSVSPPARFAYHDLSSGEITG